jgi:hypothetical protein
MSDISIVHILISYGNGRYSFAQGVLLQRAQDAAEKVFGNAGIRMQSSGSQGRYVVAELSIVS